MRRFVAFALLCLIVSSAAADNWPRFRGPNGQGIAEDSGIPASWTEKDVAWKVALAGKGRSSPVVWDDTVYVTSADEGSSRFTLQALGVSSGATLWMRSYPFVPGRIHPLNSHASSTPTVDENGVYFLLFGEDRSVVIALDHEGTELWSRDFGPLAGQHGPSQSPMISQGMLVFSLEHELNPGLESFWYALSLKNGETVWRLERETGESSSSSVPCVYRSGTGEEWLIFTSRSHGISAVNPLNGRLVWEEKHVMTARVVSSPVLFRDLIITTCGMRNQGLRLTAVRPRVGESQPEVAHTIEERFVPYVPTSLATDEFLFLFQDRGGVSCVDLESGRVLWNERPAGRFFGSPVLVGDRLYCIDTRGQVVVLRAGSDYELLGINDLGEGSHSTPAVAGGRMFLRTDSHLSCVEALPLGK